MSNKEFSLYLVPKVSSICDEIVNYYVKSLSPKVFEEIISNKTKDTPISCYIIVKTLIDV